MWLLCCCSPERRDAERAHSYSHFVEPPSSSGACAHPWHSPDSPGAPHFKQLRLLGCGTYSKVMLVERATTGELYAMKRIEKKEAVDPVQVC